MRRAILLGVPDTKRTLYLKRAAAQAGLPLFFWDWDNWGQLQAGSRTPSISEPLVVKIDPPRWDSPALNDLNCLAGTYQKRLRQLEEAADTFPIRFLNRPSAIMALLDKVQCKETLRRAGLPVTETLAISSSQGKEGMPADTFLTEDAGQLLAAMQKQGVRQVFIKPVNGSAAAGVLAFRLQKSSGRMALYTCAMAHPQKGLINTRQLRCFSDQKQIFPILNQILAAGCIVERWHAKSSYQGYSYDLRAVVQGGSCDFLLARLSKGPITNLQLNNRPLPVAMLGLNQRVLHDVTDLCQKAVGLFPGLSYAGIDILLEKGSLKPRIIEMNGQGDLIYQDIYQDNTIYRHQAKLLKQLTEEHE